MPISPHYDVNRRATINVIGQQQRGISSKEKLTLFSDHDRIIIGDVRHQPGARGN